MRNRTTVLTVVALVGGAIALGFVLIQALKPPPKKRPVIAGLQHAVISLDKPGATPVGKLPSSPRWRFMVKEVHGPESMNVVPFTMGPPFAADPLERVEGRRFDVIGLDTKSLRRDDIIELPYLFRVSFSPTNTLTLSVVFED